MFIRNVENALALACAVLVLIGVSVATRTAFADEPTAVSTVDDTVQSALSVSRAAAKTATHDAADDAVEGVATDNELDLDFHMLDHKSVQSLTAVNRPQRLSSR